LGEKLWENFRKLHEAARRRKTVVDRSTMGAKGGHSEMMKQRFKGRSGSEGENLLKRNSGNVLEDEGAPIRNSENQVEHRKT